MVTMQFVMEQLTDKGIVEVLEAVMAEIFEDFADTRRRYINAIAALKGSLGKEAEISPEEETEAIQQQAVSDLLFSGLLGLKANWDHFIDPIERNFLEVDSEIYLREETAHRLPAYVTAQEIRNRFYAQLSPLQQKLYEDVNTYACYLETAGPKLAHYYGYMLGNQLLPRVVPGYHQDRLLNMRYTVMMESYFGRSVAKITETLL